MCCSVRLRLVGHYRWLKTTLTRCISNWLRAYGPETYRFDYQALRFACSAARNCEVHGNVTDLAARAEAERKGDLATAQKLTEKMLSRGYADLETHAELVAIYTKVGDEQRSDFHRSATAC